MPQGVYGVIVNVNNPSSHFLCHANLLQNKRETLIQAFDSGHDREFECDIFNKYFTN